MFVYLRGVQVGMIDLVDIANASSTIFIEDGIVAYDPFPGSSRR